MVDTRNNNSKNNYCIQQRSYADSRNYLGYINGSYGEAYKPAYPCLGYTPSHMSWTNLSYNPVEIESSLFGINSTNLVNPQKPIVPHFKKVPYISFFNRVPLIMPKPLNASKTERPFPIPE